MAKQERVDLGFVSDDCDSRLLESRYFPSKVGGKPAWLSLNPIPPTDQLTCSKCGNQMTFLMQIYSPRERHEGDAFHRTLFLFLCRNASCCSLNEGSNFSVFRTQLPRLNQFYSADPPPDDPCEDTGLPAPTAAKYQKMCAVCGCLGSKQCSRCHATNYCSKDHQTRHWKAGHKTACGKQDAQEPGATTGCDVLFPEFEVEIEEENFNPSTTTKDETEAMQEYEQCLQNISSSQSEMSAHFSDQDLEGMASKETEDDRQFKKFQKRVAQNKDQILRYSRGGQPLWVSSEHQAKEMDIPACSCGAPRQFEFQVMPQLLYYMQVDKKDGNSLDWGTLCIYTCQDSCSIGNKYVKEFIWKQDFLSDR